MFEGLIENLLKSILGQYIENVDSQKLSVSIWNGQISLSDLKIKQDIFQQFNLPFKLKLGIIKQLKLEIPWTRLSSSPVICNLDRLYLILTPQIESEWILQDTSSIEFKQKKLVEILNKYIQEAKINFTQLISDEMEKLNKNGKSQKQAKQQAGYFERYITRIKDNLRVQISNIHVRLEDRHSSLLKTFDFEKNSKREFNNSCLGLILKEISLKTVQSKTIIISNQTFDSSSDIDQKKALQDQQTVEASQIEESVNQDFFFDATLKENQGKPIHKELSIKGLSIYIDSGPDVVLLSFPQKFEEKNFIQQQVESQDSDPNKQNETLQLDANMLDKAMQTLNENIFEDQINWQPVKLLLGANLNNITDWNTKHQNLLIQEEKSQDMMQMKKMNFVIRPQSIMIQLTQNPVQAFSNSQEQSQKQKIPQYQLDIRVTDLKFQLQKCQYLSIFRFADFIRKYNMKQEFLNKHKKYKQFRPLFPILTKKREILNQLSPQKEMKNDLDKNDQDQKEDMEFGAEDPLNNEDDSENDQVTENIIDQNNYPQIKLQCKDIGFDQAFESFQSNSNGLKENFVCQDDNDKQIKKQQFNQLNLEIKSKKNRNIFHKIETENCHAKAWWQYAITCVIKDNRQLSNSQVNQYQIHSVKKKQIKSVISHYVLQHLQSQPLNKQQNLNNKKKKAKKSKKNQQSEQILNIEFRSQMEKYLFQYCILTISTGEIEDLIKKAANQFLQDQISQAKSDLQKKQEELQLNNEKKQQSQIDQNVKQSYGAAILSYVNFWGGKTSHESENEQRKQAEAAVEAIAIAEQDLENKQNEDSNFKECLEMDLETFDDCFQEDKKKIQIEEQDSNQVQQVRYHLQVRCYLDRGSIVFENISENESSILFFQQVNFQYQYHQGLQKIKVSTFNWGINNVKILKFPNSEPIIKPLVKVLKNQNQAQNQYNFKSAWKFSLTIKTDEFQEIQREIQNEKSNEQSKIQTIFEAREIQIYYEPQIIQNFQKFLQIDEQNDFKAHALDKLAQISEESQQNLRDIIQQQKVSNIEFKFEKITIKLPFKAQNSKYVNEPEEQRDRTWLLHLEDLQFTQVQNVSIEEIYQKFNMSVKSASFQLAKRSYPFPFKVVEDIQINLLIEVKNKFKAKYMLEKYNKIQNLKQLQLSEISVSQHEAVELINPDQLPDIKISIANLNKVILNLTPDSFNSLVNITYVLLPESTKEEIIRQIKEKQKVIRESTFKNCMSLMGLKEYRLSNNWKNYYVVISGCYIYFYKQEDDLVPFHYLYIMSISVQEVNFNQMINKEEKNSQDLTDCVLMIKSRNGEQIFLNLGKTINKGQFISGRSRSNSISSSNSGGKRTSSEISSQLNKPQISDDQSCKSSQFSSSHQSDETFDLNSKEFQAFIGLNSKLMNDKFSKNILYDLMKTQKTKQKILSLIHQKQIEFRTQTEEIIYSEDSASQQLPKQNLQKFDANYDLKNLTENQISSNNLNQDNKQYFSLSVRSSSIQVRVFKDDFLLMNCQENFDEGYQANKDLWVQLIGEQISFETIIYPFQYQSNLKIKQVSLQENLVIKRELIILPDELMVQINLWSINSPTIKDCEMEVKVDISGRPIILFDPTFFNQLIKYFKNIQNQYFENYRELQAELLKQDRFQMNDQKQEEKAQEDVLPSMRHTCENVEIVILRTILNLQEGLTLICMHHQYLMSPFVELSVKSLTLNYDSMYDHDQLSIQMEYPDLYDLTMWPKSIIPINQQLNQADSLLAQDFYKSFKKQIMIGQKFNMDLLNQHQKSKISIDQTFFYENCPFYKTDCAQKCLIKFSNMSLFYYQEQFFRFISYLTNRFIYAIGDTDPYQEFQSQIDKIDQSNSLDQTKINDLKQYDLQTDLKLEMENISIILRERPYMIEQWLEFKIESIQMTQSQFSLLKRHSTLPQLQMKLLQFIYKFKNVQILHCINSLDSKKTESISNVFDIELKMNMPSYSELLEKISSKMLDKSTNIEVVLHPQLKLNICQNAYTFLMRCISLNICYYDGKENLFDFTQVAEYFQSKENILYMKTKIKIEKDIIIILEQNDDQSESKEIVEARLRSYQSSSQSKENLQKDIIVMEQYLDGQFKINIFMGIPTLIYPSISESNEVDGQLLDQKEIKDQNKFLKHLLVGTQQDPHIFEIDKEMKFVKEEEQINTSNVQNLIDQFECEDKNEQNKRKESQGKFFWKINYLADGSQMMESRIEKAKIILKPFNFLKIVHFFGYGYPEYQEQMQDGDSIGEWPNQWETDFEKMPEMKIKMEIKDCLICMDGFDTGDLLEYKQNINFFQFQQEDINESMYDPRDSLFKSNIFQSMTNFKIENQSFHVKNLNKIVDEDQSISFNIKKQNFENQHQNIQQSKTVSFYQTQKKQEINFSTIACKTDFIEYTYKRDEIQKIKTKLFDQFKIIKNKLRLNNEMQDQIAFQNNEDAQIQDQEASLEQFYLRMNLSIKGFSSYICNSFDLDEQGFQDIQKRQLISPMDIKFLHQKFMKLLIPKNFYMNQNDGQTNTNKQCSFNIFQNNDLKLDKTLCKVTFSDAFILQQVSKQISKSHAQYKEFLAQYLLNVRKQDIIRLQSAKENQSQIVKDSHEVLIANENNKVWNSRTQLRKISFHSFTSIENNSQKMIGSDADSELFYDFNPQEEQNMLKVQLNENLQQIRNNFVNYMTGFGAQQRLQIKKRSGSGITQLKFRAASENSDQELHQNSQSFQSQEIEIESNDNTLIQRYKSRKLVNHAHSKSFGASQSSENFFVNYDKKVTIIKEEDQDKEEDFSIKHFEHGSQSHDALDIQFDSKNSALLKLKDQNIKNADASGKVSENYGSEQNQFFSIKENQLDQVQLQIAKQTLENSLTEQNENQISSKDKQIIENDQIQSILKDEEIIDWEVDYGDSENFSSIKFSSQINIKGILLMIINDREGIFYPILQMNLDQIKINLDNNISNLRGETEIRGRMNYFNNKIDTWEPFLESTVLRLVVEQNEDEKTQSLHACFKSPVNLNITEEFVENLLNAYNDLIKSKKEEEHFIKQQQMVTEHRRSTMNAKNQQEKKQSKFQTVQISSQKSLIKEQEITEIKKKQQLKVKAHNQQIKNQNLEFKVAPFKLVNMTSKVIVVKRKIEDDFIEEQKQVEEQDQLQSSKQFRTIGRHGVQSRQGPQTKSGIVKLQSDLDQDKVLNNASVQRNALKDKAQKSQTQNKKKQKEKNKNEIATTYRMEVGESVDYEVDYEQEATQILMTNIDDLIKKKNLVDIQFISSDNQDQEAIKDHNLVNLDQHIHFFSKQNYDFVLYGMSIDDSKLKKTFTIRNPFIIYNQTKQNYMVKIRVSRSKDSKLIQLAAGKNYPLSYSDLSSHIHFCLESDYYQELNDQVENSNDVWSSSFKLCNFYNREEIQKKKFFVYHKKKFSMIFIKPAKFNKGWDIILKTPLVIKNALPFGLYIKTKMIQDFKLSDNSYQSQNNHQKKDLIYEEKEVEFLIKKQEKQCFQNFNLDEGITFSLTFDIPNKHRNTIEECPFLMDWSPFTLSKKEYKNSDKTLELFDVTSGQILEIGAKIKPTDETDLEITFYCFNSFINNTDQNIVLYFDDKKSKLPCINDSQIIPLSERAQKIFASIENEDPKQNEQNQNDKLYQQGFPVNLVSLTSKITLMKQKDMYYDFILNTHMSLVTETDDIYVKITTINPQNIIVNQTNMILLFSQMGYHTKNAEVLLPKSRVPLYWTDIKGKQRIHFKVAEQQQNQGFLESVFDWTKSINPQKIGTISITCRNLQDQALSKHLRIIKRVNQQTQTTFIIVKIEEEQCPLYKIENLTESIQLEYYQQGITPIQDCWRTSLPPGESKIFSWIDPEPIKNFKGILCCNLNLINKKENRNIKTLQKLQIKLDDLKYKKRFAGNFIIDDSSNQVMTGDIIKNENVLKKQLLGKRSSIYQIESQKYLQDQSQQQETDTVIIQEVQEKIIELKIVTNGYTNILKVTERMKNQQEEAAGKSNIDFHIKQIGQKIQTKQNKIQNNQDLMEQIEDDVSFNKNANIQREIKVQIDLSVMQISFIAKSQKNQRCEFMLAYIQEIEFLQIESHEDTCMQIKIADFQLDNNIQNQDGSSQIFPYIIYAKEVLNPKVQAPSIFRRKQAVRKDFFNLFINMKKKNSDEDLLFIHKIQFLLQSLVIQIDDQTLDWIIRFLENFTKNLGSNITDVHYIFQSENDQIKKIMQMQQNQSKDNFENQNNEFRISVRDDQMNFDENIYESQYFEEPSIQRSTYSQFKDSLVQQQQFSNFPIKRNNVLYKYSSIQFTKKTFENHILKSSDFWLKYDVQKSQNPIFIQELQMSPIDLEMSFRTRGLKNENLNDKSNVLLRRFKQFRVNLYSFEKAPININSIQLSNVFGTPDEIISVLQIRYKHLIIKNILGIFSFLSSTNLLGNINLFFHDIGTGAKDFFYKPIEGFVDGPIEGGKGIVIGTASLLANTAKGGFGVVSRIANLFSKSILIIAADDDYMDQRERKALDKPNNIVSGMAFGVESTVTGLASGLYGVVSKPVKGAKEGGIKGFFKGTAKGIGGVIAKPISGGFDFIAKTTEGAGNMMKMGGRQAKKEKGQMESKELTASFAENSDMNQSKTFNDENDPQKEGKNSNDKNKTGEISLSNKQSQIVQKIRIYRAFYGKNQRLKDYHEFQACVFQHLKMICDGEFCQDHFLDALIYDNGIVQCCVILTEERILIVDAETKRKINNFPIEMIQGIERRIKQIQHDYIYQQYDQASQYINEDDSINSQQKNYELVIRVFKFTERQRIFSSGKPKGLGISKINLNQLQIKKNIINIRGKLPGISCASKNNFFNDFDEMKEKKSKIRQIGSPKFAQEEEKKSSNHREIDVDIDYEANTETQILERQELNQTSEISSLMNPLDFEKQNNEQSFMIEDGFIFEIKDPNKFNAIYNKIQHYILYVLSLKKMHRPNVQQS